MADRHCGNCKYVGWYGLQKWCRHPDHVEPIRRPDKSCQDWLDEETKHMPGETPPWPYPVSLIKERR